MDRSISRTKPRARAYRATSAIFRFIPQFGGFARDLLAFRFFRNSLVRGTKGTTSPGPLLAAPENYIFSHLSVLLYSVTDLARSFACFQRTREREREFQSEFRGTRESQAGIGGIYRGTRETAGDNGQSNARAGTFVDANGLITPWRLLRSLTCVHTCTAV